MHQPAPNDMAEELADVSLHRRVERQRKRSKEFIRGPLPWSWFSVACKLPGKSVAIALAIWFRVGLSGRKTVKLTPSLLERCRVHRRSAHRAIEALETAGLIAVDRHRGRSPLVTVLQPKTLPPTTTSDEQPSNTSAACQCCHCGRSGR